MSHATSLKAVQSQTNSTLPGPTAESQASSVTPPGARISAQFPEEQLRGVYRAIYARRDIRHFLPDPIPDQILARLVQAAHHGPSVGFMQPWDFILIRDTGVRQQVRELFLRERQAAACFFDEPRRSQYLSLKLEGILDAPVNLCITCDPTRADIVLGRNSVPETDVYSTCCAVQNLWLAARAEGIGMGWVSILKLPQLRQILGVPSHVIPVAYLCLGYVSEFPGQPLLEKVGWRQRMDLNELLHFDGWAGNSSGGADCWQGFQQALAEGAPIP
ncbi:MAG: 5,6-dimethylbenzimidazole synthase [SAR202 cluster bacterium]|nr:5,6-dimethylbenzimidazole synthase [SAR202 cluster bacterium]